MTFTEIEIPQTEARDAVGYYEFKPGVYEATVAHIESVDNPFEDDKQQLEFTFEITGFQNEDGSPATRRSWANPVFNSKSKLFGWCVAILGDEMPQKGEPFRTSLLIGRPCQVVLNAGTNQQGDKIVKLTDILPPKESQPKPGLVAALKKGAKPDKVDVIDFDMCSAPGCAVKADAYTSKGTPFCDAHMP